MAPRLNWQALTTVSSPWAWWLVGPEAEVDNFVAEGPISPNTVVIRILRGSRCPNAQHLFQEWAAALQFPYYFGHNWDAFEECLLDLGWLPGTAYVLFLTRTDLVLADEPAHFATLLQVLGSVAAEWQGGTGGLSPASHTVAPFKVVFHCEVSDEAAAAARLAGRGARLACSR